MSSNAPLINIPRDQKATLIFDACALNELASVPLIGKQSWLRLLAETASLPTVNLIIIPAYIADWELRGGYSVIDENGKVQFVRVDEDFAEAGYIKGEHDAQYEKLFNSASQYRYSNGQYTTIIGSIPKIIVVETDYQRYRFQRLVELNAITDPERKQAAINEFRSQRNTGENEMEYIATNGPIHNPAYIISTDITHFTHRDNNATTISGYPIGTAKLTDYIQAELQARASHFRSLFGVSSLSHYCDKAMKFGAYPHLSRYPSGYKDTGPGKYLVEKDRYERGENLTAIFQRGQEALKGLYTPIELMPPYDSSKTEIMEPLASLSTIFADRLHAGREWMQSIFLHYQLPIADAIIDDLRQGNTGGVVKEPTGSGKTIVMGAIAKVLDTRTLIVVPKKFTAHQIAKALTKTLHINPEDIGIYHSDVSKSKKAVALDKKIVIVTSMGMIKMVKRGAIKRGDFPYCALDEAHRMRGEITAATIREIFLPDSIVHAFTATDRFSDGSVVGETLFNRREHIHSTTIKTAIKEGWTCRSVKNIVIRTRVDFREVPAHLELNEIQQRALASRTGRDEQALTMSYSYVDKDTGTVFSEELSKWYCGGVNHARHITDKLNKLHGEGYAKCITGETKDQETIFQEHREGKFKALVSADIAIDSYDNPACSICYMLRDSLSPWIVEQTGGRVVRVNPRNPDKAAFIVSLVDEGRPYSLVFADVAEGWLITSDNSSPASAVLSDPNKEKKLPPEYPPLESLDIVETEREFIEFFRQREEEKQNLIFPLKTADWYTRSDLIKYLGTSTQNIPLMRFLEDAEPRFRKGEDIVLDGEKLKVGFKSNYKLTPFCYHISAVNIIAKHFELDLEEKTHFWKNKSEVAKAIGTSTIRGGFTRLWDAIVDEYEKTGMAHINGIPLICGRKKTPDATRWRSFCVHISEIEKVREGIGFKTEEWLALHDMEEKIGTSRKNKEFVGLWKDLKAQYERHGVANIGLRKIKCGIRGQDNNPAFCLHISEAEFIKSHLKLDIPVKTDDWLNLRQTGKALNTNPTNSPLSKLWESFDTVLRMNGKVYVDKEQLNAQIMQAGSNRVMCVHKDEMDKLRKELGLNVELRTDEWIFKTALRASLSIGGAEFARGRLFTELWENIERQYEAKGHAIIDNHVIRLERRRGDTPRSPILLCIHRDDVVYLYKFLKLDIEEKTNDWIGVAEFHHQLGAAIKKTGLFYELFMKIKSAHDSGEDVYIGEYKAVGAYKKNSTNIDFYIHRDCLPHVKKIYKRDLFDQGGEWKAKFDYAQALDTNQYNKAFKKIWDWLESEHKQGRVPAIRGEQLKCGYMYVGESHGNTDGLRFYVNLEHKAVLQEQLKDNQQQLAIEKQEQLPASKQVLKRKLALPVQFNYSKHNEEFARELLREVNPVTRYKLLTDFFRKELHLTVETAAEELTMSAVKFRQCISLKESDSNISLTVKQHNALIAKARLTLTTDFEELLEFFEADYGRAYLRRNRQEKIVEECLEELASNVKNLYQRRGMIWNDVAGKAGINESMSTLFSRVPSAETLHRIIEVLDPDNKEEKLLCRLQLKAYTKRYDGSPGVWADKPENKSWVALVTESLTKSLLPEERERFSSRR